MRIAYVCADPGVPVFGRKGSSVHVQEVIRGLLRHGARVELFAVRTGGEPPHDLGGVPLCRLRSPPDTGVAARERWLLDANATLRQLLEAHGPFDLVYERQSLWSYAAMEYAAQSSTPGLLEVNAPLVEEQARHRALLDIEAATEATARAFRAASVVLAVSLEVADYVRRCPGAPRAVVLPNGVDPERIRPDVEPSRRGRPGSFTFGFVGTLKPWHGLHTLVQAFASVRRRHSNVRLLIVGDGPERERVASSAREAGCAHAVEFTGAVDPADVPALLTSMDAGVAPYPKLEHCYFSPLKLYEYMAAALPVVASDIGQVAEVIQHDVTGLLCPPGDARALANAFVRLMEDPNLRHTLGRNARAAVQREHTWSAVTARILELAGQNVRATEAGVRG